MVVIGWQHYRLKGLSRWLLWYQPIRMILAIEGTPLLFKTNSM